MNCCERVVRAGAGAVGNGENGEKRKFTSPDPDKVEKEWGISVDLLDDMDKKLLKSLLNEGWRKETRGLRRGEANVSLDVEDKKRVRCPLNETNTRVGICRRVQEKTGKQTTRFDRSMRVLEWLDADCGTRLARHYEQAGGWRSLPQRHQRACHHHQPPSPPPQQPQRAGLAGQSAVYKTGVCSGYVKDSEDDSSSEEEKRILEEEEEDELFNDEDADDDDDLVLALRKWQEEQLLQQEHYEDLSMQEYVTSSEDDSKEEDSDSEDELVLALKTWQEEQLRQQKLQQQQQQQQHQLPHHRQVPLAQQPPALTPVIEDQVSSPSRDGFGYFYQDQNYLVYRYNKQRSTGHQQQPTVTPYWWGDISSVREGPSSPPVLVKHSEAGKSCSATATFHQGHITTSHKARGGNNGGSILVTADFDNNVKFGNVRTVQGPSSTSQKPTTALLTTTALSSSSAPAPRSSSHYSSLLLPPSSSGISPVSSPRVDAPNWSFGNRVKTLASSECNSSNVKFATTSTASDTSSASIHTSSSGSTNHVFTPQTSYVTRTTTITTSGPSSVSNVLSPTSSFGVSSDVTKCGGNGKYTDSQLQTANSGIDIRLGSTSPISKPVGIDRIGYFFRKFQNKLSTSSGSSSSFSKATSSDSAGKKSLQQQHVHKGNGNNSRRLSLSTTPIPSPPAVKPSSPSPVVKFSTDHARCSATRSDPLAASAATKRLRTQWLIGHRTKNTAHHNEFPSGEADSTPAGRCLVSNVSLDSNSSALSGDRVIGGNSGGGSGGPICADGGPVASAFLTPGDRKSALSIDTFLSSNGSDGRKGGTTPTFGVGAGSGSNSSSIGKVVVVGGKEAQPFVVPNTYQQSHQHQWHQQPRFHATKPSTGEINRNNFCQQFHSGALADSTSQSGSGGQFFQDNFDTLKISHEAFDNTRVDNDKSGAGYLSNGAAHLGWSGAAKGPVQILNKSPGSETEHKIHTDSVERDPQGKIRTLRSFGGVAVNGSSNTVNGSISGVNGSSIPVGSISNIVSGSSNANFVSSLSECSNNAAVNCVIESKSREAKIKEEFVNSRSTERTSSTSSEEKATLAVPDAGHDRSRRGSHGSCNHLFRESMGGRKSPLFAKGRTSPSPVRTAPLKGVASSSTLSSSAAESSSKQPHQSAGRVLTLSLPSSSPSSHLQPTAKLSPKQLPSQNGSESPPTKIISSDGPPANYRSRRKFSDTGLSPVPRRLFCDGRRGSLTDVKSLGLSKSKSGKLRGDDRKLSDASSVAALVKQIHNLWGQGEHNDDYDDEEEDRHRRELTSVFTGSFDDQILFEKRRKEIPLSIHQQKEVEKNGEERKSLNKITCTFGGAIDNACCRSEGLVNSISPDGKRKNHQTADKGTLLPVASVNSSALGPSVNPGSVTAGDTDSQTCDKLFPESVKDNPANGIPPAADSIISSGGGGGSGTVLLSGGGLSATAISGLSGSEFVAPLAQVVSRQLVAAAVSSVACFVGIDAPDSLITLGPAGISTGNTAGLNNSTSGYSKPGKKVAIVQFQPIVSRDDNTVGEKVSPALRSVLKQATRRHSSFAGFSESNDDIAALQPSSSDNLTSPLKKLSKNGLPKSRTSDNYKSILKTTEKPTLSEIDSSTSVGDKKRSKSPSPKTKKGDKAFDYSPDAKNSELSLSLCLKATRSLSPRLNKYRTETKDYQDSTDHSSQATPFSSTDREQFTDSGNCSLDLPTKTVGIQATPRTFGKTSNTGTQTSDLSAGGESSTEQSSSSPPEGSGWLQRLAAKCMASVGGSSRSGAVGGGGAGASLPRAASVRAEWLLGNKRMGSNPSSPVAPTGDASEKFWVPHGVIARKRAQSLVPSISKQESEDDLSSEAATPATIPHPRDLAFSFANEKPGTSGGSSDGQPPTPPSGYNPGRRRASMHDAIDLNKIDARLYDKKLVRQASVTSIEEESQGTVHVSLQHNSETGILTVNLVRAHNLLPRDINYTANPYCRITILPGQRSSAQSRIHRKTLNPEFEEEFIFELPAEEVARSSLEVSFYEYDQFSKDECVGYVRIPLNEMDLSKQVDLWRSISPYDKPKDQRDLGDVMFSLSYLPSAERLTVVVVRARNLRLLDDGKLDLNPFIKVWITSGSKKLKKKKTSTAHSTNSPIWNEALVFSVPRESLKNIGLEVSAYHDNKLGIDECIGRIRLPANSPEGIQCQELLKEKNMPARWYNLT